MSATIDTRALNWRWPLSLTVVALLHGAAFFVLRDLHPAPPPEIPHDAILLDLAPAAPEPAPAPPEEAAPPQPPSTVQPPPPEPPPPEPPPEPPPPEPPPPELPPPEPVLTQPAIIPPPAVVPVEPEVVLPPPPPPPPPRPARVRPRQPPVVKPRLQPHPVAVAPPTPEATPQPAAVPAPQAVPSPSRAPPGVDAATWDGRLAAHLKRFRQYPPEAERRGFTGVASVRFSVDATGHIVSATLVHSSGHEQLDQEALDWLQRAQPLPIPPSERVAPAQISVPLNFTLR